MKRVYEFLIVVVQKYGRYILFNFSYSVQFVVVYKFFNIFELIQHQDSEKLYPLVRLYNSPKILILNTISPERYYIETDSNDLKFCL